MHLIQTPVWSSLRVDMSGSKKRSSSDESHELKCVFCHSDSSSATRRHLIQTHAELSSSHTVRPRRTSTRHSSGSSASGNALGSSFRLRKRDREAEAILARGR